MAIGRTRAIAARLFIPIFHPPNYRFRVIACNNSGVWNETRRGLWSSCCAGVLSDEWVPHTAWGHVGDDGVDGLSAARRCVGRGQVALEQQRHRWSGTKGRSAR